MSEPRPVLVDPAYEPLARIASGGTGNVWRARDHRDGSLVALKILDSSSDVDARALGAREFLSLASLDHPHIVRVLAFGATRDGRAAFAMELCEGRDLLSWARGELPAGPGARAADPRFALAMAQVLAGLECLHTRGLVHGDLKPANILVLDTGVSPPHIKLIDLGLAREVADSTGDGRDISGTLAYLAPERLRAEPASPASDLYAFGCILFELLTGDVPHGGESARELARARLAGERPTVEAIPERLRPGLVALLATDPRDRPPTADLAAIELLGPEARRAMPPPLGFAGPLRGPAARLLELILRESRRDSPRSKRAVLVRGPRGSGRSRLLCELRFRLEIAGDLVRALSLGGRSGGKSGPAAVAIALLEGLRPLSVDPSARRHLRAIEDALDADPAGFDIDQNTRRERAAHSISEALLALAESQPLTILIDDLEAADSLSVEIVRALSRLGRTERCDRLRVIATVADDTEAGREIVDRIAPRGRELSALAVHSLEPLSAGDVDSWLHQVLGEKAEVPVDLARKLWKSATGVPLFLEEALRKLVESGRLERRRGRWCARDLDAVPVPDSLAVFAVERVALLDPRARRILAEAALLGRPFTPVDVEMLDRVLANEASTSSASREEIECVLSRAALDGILERRGSVRAFRHESFRIELETALAPEERRVLHGAVATALERSLGRDPATVADAVLAAEIAEHWFLSNEPGKSRGWLRFLSAIDSRSGALPEARDRLTKLLGLSDEWEETRGILLEREEVLRSMGLYEEAMEDIAELRRLALSRADRNTLRELLVREALVLDARGDKPRALAKAEEARAFPPARPIDEARLLVRTAMLRIWIAELPHAAEDIERALEIARAEADRSVEAEALQVSGLAAYFGGRYDEALKTLDSALAIRRALGDSHRAGAIESNIGLIAFDRGRLEAAEERFESALRHFRGAGFRRGIAASAMNLGLVWLELGRFEAALDALGESSRIRDEIDDLHGRGADLGNMGAVWMRLGLDDRARPLIEEAIALARRTGNRSSGCVNLCRLALILAGTGEIHEAEVALGRAEETGRTADGTAVELEVALARARLAIAAGHTCEALPPLARARELARSSDRRTRLLEAIVLSARAVLELGELDEADVLSREAISLLERLPASLERTSEAWFVRYEVAIAIGKTALPQEIELEALEKAHAALRRTLDDIEDPELRRAYLERVPLHRSIVGAHAEHTRRTRSDAELRERSFYEIARTIHSIRELDPLLERLLELAIHTTHADKGLILLREPGGNLTVRAARGMRRESVEDATEICQSVIADVAGGAAPVLAIDAGADERFRERQSIISFRIRTLMCAPLATRDDVLGAVYVDGRGNASFTPGDLDWLVSFGRLAAIAVDNARLLDGLRIENRELRRRLEVNDADEGPEGMIGRSSSMRRLFGLVERSAQSDVTVLITGETGTGKSLLARRIHRLSRRSSGPFVTVDCGALPPNLLESELFGHARGAFSGAFSDRAGLFEEATGGTIFLDEIANTSLDLQAKLLRAIQENEIRRVGENKSRAVDVRVIAATNSPLEQLVSEGRFREDLYYRLHVIHLDMPPLRDRIEDIAPLAIRFLARACELQGRPPLSLSEPVLRYLRSLPYRGNIRELENLMEKVAVLSEDDGSVTEDTLRAMEGALLLPRDGSRSGTRDGPGKKTNEGSGRSALLPPGLGTTPLPLAEFDRLWIEAERGYLLHLVETTGWNVSAACRVARVRNRNTLVSRLRKHGIERPEE